MKPTNLLIALVFLLIPWTTKAQVIPDKTLLTEVDSEFNITGGQTIRENLFHSFEQFSPSAGTRVTFHQSQFIKNIFTRVTGSSPSLINGEINILAGEEIGKANLFLINPNGIIFGSGAALNIGGSFFGTTAQGVIFDDGSIFSANPSATSSLLNVRVPIGLVFSEAARAIKVETNPDIPLEVPFEKTLALVGGEIKITQRTLKTPQGQIQIASVAEGIVNITEASGGDGNLIILKLIAGKIFNSMKVQ
jgi:filamentous hemagglutinin family protein